MILAICALFPAVVAGKGGCVAVPKDKCGDQWFNSCLKCGTASSFDCEECCPGCKLVSKAPYYYCQCGAPKPGPSPGPAPFPPGGDSWQRYTVDGMDVIAVTGVLVGGDPPEVVPLESKRWMVREAVEELCLVRRRGLPGWVESMIGSLAWFMLLGRGGFSMLSAVYPYSI